MKTFTKRSLAIFIAVLMIFSVMAVSFSSVSATTSTPSQTSSVTTEEPTTEDPTTEDPSTRIVALAGSFNGWSLTDNTFEYDSDSTFHHQVILAPGTYTFKVVQDGLWYGANKIIDGSTSSDIKMDIVSGDCAIESAGGKYDFYFNTDTKALSILFTKMDIAENTEIPKVALSGSFNNWVVTDMMMPSSAASFYYPACDSSYTSLNTALTSIDVDNSKEHRMEIALVNGIEDYTYTPEQNTAMLKLLKAGMLLNPDAVVYYPACDATCTSLNSALTSIGVDNSKAHRMEIALANGITDYAYTAEQNTAMLKLLKAGKLLNPDALGFSGDNTVSKTIDLNRGEYYFSIVENGLWYGNTSLKLFDNTEGEVVKVNGGACTLVASGGTYTFIYNYKTNTLIINSVTNYDPSQLTVVSLSGEFNNWAKNDLFGETSATTVEKTVELKRGEYKFKIVQDGLWYGNNGTIEDTTTTTSSNGWEMSINDGDCILKASGGTYTFIFTVTTKRLTVEFIPSTETPAEMADVTLAGEFNSWDKDSIPFTPVTDTTVEATVSLTAGSYDFKIVEDKLWYGNGQTINNSTEGMTLSYIGENSTLVTTGGDFTFIYDVISKLLVVKAELTDIKPVELSEVYLAGEFNEWETETEASMMEAISDSVVSKTVPLKAGAYKFKVVKDGLWYGNTTRIANTTSDKLTLSYTADECILVASGGEYTFNFDVTTNKLSVTYKASTEDPAKTAKVYLSGDFNDWSTTKTQFSYYATYQVATTVSLKAGVYSFKVVQDGLWYGWDEETIYDSTYEDLQLSIKNGECTIDCYGGDYTFIFDVISQKLKITAKISDFDPAETAIVSLAGDFNKWATGEDMMFYYGTKNVVSCSVELRAGTYLFKIVDEALWYGNGKEIADSTASIGTQKLTITDSECILKASGGVYTFHYNVINHQLDIEFEELEFDYTSNATVSVAGEFNQWNTAVTPMTALSNELMYVDVPLNKGDYYFKIVHDGNWFGNSGGVIKSSVDEMMTSNTATDILLKAENTGVYTFIYNVVTNSLSVYYDSEDFASYAQVFLVGSFNNWDDSADQLTYKGNGILSKTVKLNPGTYEFKIASEGVWYGNEGIINNTTTITSNIGWAMSSSAGNCTLKANGGSYTFNYNFNTNFLEVIYNG